MPASQSVPVGNSAQFDVATTGTYPVLTKWQLLLPGAGAWAEIDPSNPSYPWVNLPIIYFSSTTLAMNGTKLRCVAWNSEGTVTSDEATLTVAVPPPVYNVTIFRSPHGVVPYDAYLQFDASYSANGQPGLLSYQWYRNGVPVAQGNPYSVRNVTAADAGSYTVTITNSGGSASSPAEVVVVETPVPPAITTQPAGLTIEAGLQFTLSSGATGSQPLKCQWYLNGQPIAGATYPTYNVSAATAAHGGIYAAVFTNTAGAVATEQAIVNVVPAALPTIISTQYGSDYAIGPGNTSLQLSIQAVGGKPIAYQWFKDGVAIPGANSPTFLKYQVTAADAGVYVLQLSNEAGAILSRPQRVIWSAPAPTTAWLASQRLGNIVYFLLKSPGRILRYDLVQQAWLPAVALNPATDPTGFLPTPEGVFVAYSGTIVRRSPDLQTETAVATVNAVVSNFFARGALIYFVSAYQTYSSYNRTTLAAGPSGSTPGELIWDGLLRAQPVISDITGRGYTTRPYVSPNDVIMFDFDGAGAITTAVDSPYHGDFPVGTKRYVSPDGTRLYDSGGLIYRATDLTCANALGSPFDDLAFLDDGSVVVLRGNQLVRHEGSNAGELGRRALAAPGTVLAARGNTLYVFSAAAPGATEPAVALVSAADFAPTPAGPPPLDPAATRLSVDQAFIDDAGVVHVLSRVLRGIARWDTANHQFLPSLALQGDPLASSYAPAARRLVLAYGDGRITDFEFSVEAREKVIGQYTGSPNELTITAADELTIFEGLPQGSTIVSRLELAPGGVATYTRASDNVYGADQAWDSATRRLYSYSNIHSISATTGYATIPPGGVLPAAVEQAVAGMPSLVPLRFSATSSEALLATGAILSKELAPLGNLGTPVKDGLWLADGLYTIRAEASGTRVEKWARAGYGRLAGLSVAGKPVRVLRVSDSRLVIVTLVNGYLAFHLVPTSLASLETFLSNADTGGRPVISQHPASTSAAVGATAGFTVTAAGTMPLSYRWQVSASGTDGWSDLGLQPSYSGATTAQLSVVAADSLNGLFYRCAVSNSIGVTYSGAAQLSVSATALTIVSSPVPVSATAGSTARFAVQASGSGPISYHWQSATVEGGPWVDLADDATYGGSQTSLLTVAVSAPLSGRLYRGRATNDAGAATSASAALTVSAVMTPPAIAVQPLSATAPIDTPVTFTVVAAGVGPFAYRWQAASPNAADWRNLDDGGAYSGTTTATLTVLSSLDAAGSVYRCVVSNSAGGTASAFAALTLAGRPVVRLDSARRQVIAPGQALSLAVSVTGASPFTYQWYRNGRPIPAATAAGLSRPSVGYADAGYYYVDVTGPFGATRSATMFVIIAPVVTKVIGWGNDGNLPDYSRLDGVVRLATGSGGDMGISRDGRVVTLAGLNNGLDAVPAGLTEVVEVARANAYAVALKSDGTVVSWGYASMLPVPPAGLTDVVAISASWYQAIAVKSDGTVVSWGWPDPTGFSPVPADLGPAVEVAETQILRADGTVRGWGSLADVGLTNIASIRNTDGGVGLTADGTVAMYSLAYGATVTSLTNISQLAGSTGSGLAVRNDGTVVVWGSGGFGQNNPPAGLSGAFGVARGARSYLALVAVPINDLAFGATTFPAAAVPGEHLTFNSTVTNTGTTTWGANYYLGLRDAGGAVIASASLNGMAPGASKTVTFTLIAPGNSGDAMYSVRAFQNDWFGPQQSLTLAVRVPAKTDFNGDGYSDLVWKDPANGNLYLQLMDATGPRQNVWLGNLDPAWRLAATGDLDGDGKDDLVWENTVTGERLWWRMNGLTGYSSALIGTVAPVWRIAGSGDFNADGKDDLVWENSTTGEHVIWLMNGETILNYVTLATLDPQWRLAGTGDFNADGKPDLLWHNQTSGALYTWLMDGTTPLASEYLGGRPTFWQVAASDDYNGDSHTDLVWTNTLNGASEISYLNGLVTIATRVIDAPVAGMAPGRPVVAPARGLTGDFNQDGKTDILFQNSVTGEIGAWIMNGVSPTAWIPMNTVYPVWRIAGTGDFSGDGKTDVLFQNYVTGEIGCWNMDGTVPTAWIPMNTVDTAWRIVAAADFTHDGRPDILFQNTVTGEIGCWAMNGTAATAWISMNTVSTAWRIVAAADFTHDGQPDILFQNAVTGEIGCWSMNGTAATAWIPMNTVATAWRIVTADDFTGDNQPDIVFQNTVTGEIGVWAMNGTAATAWIPTNTVATQWQIVNH